MKINMQIEAQTFSFINEERKHILHFKCRGGLSSAFVLMLNAFWTRGESEHLTRPVLESVLLPQRPPTSNLLQSDTWPAFNKSIFSISV